MLRSALLMSALFPLIGTLLTTPAPEANKGEKIARITSPAAGAGEFQTKWPAFKMVRLSAAGVPDKGGVAWRVKPKFETVPPVEVDWATPTNVKDVVWIGPPGKYDVLLITVGPDGERTSVTIDEKSIEILQPDGKPPVPPGPDLTALEKSLADALKADPDRALAVKLAEVFEAGATSTVPTAPTWGALFRGLEVMAGEKKVNGKMMPAQEVIAAHLKSKLPWQKASEDIISKDQRTVAAAAFQEVAAAIRKAVQ